MKNRFFPTGRDFEHRAKIVGAAIVSGAVKIARIVAHNAAIRQTAILSDRETGETVEDLFLACGMGACDPSDQDQRRRPCEKRANKNSPKHRDPLETGNL